MTEELVNYVETLFNFENYQASSSGKTSKSSTKSKSKSNSKETTLSITQENLLVIQKQAIEGLENGK